MKKIEREEDEEVILGFVRIVAVRRD